MTTSPTGTVRRALAVFGGPIFPDQVQAPPFKPKKDATPEQVAAWEEERHRRSPERIRVEHTNAERKQGRSLRRYPGRREDYDETYRAIAALVSDRAAER